MVDSIVGHPSIDQIVAYTLGRLDAEDQAALEQHLATCSDCCKALAQLPPNPIEELIRRSVRNAEAATQRPASKDQSTPVDGATLDEAEPALPPPLANHPRYQILRLLGQGGMGVVYLAEHRLMERTVALKVIRQNLLNEQAVSRFHREVKAAAKLAHPNIVVSYDAEQAGDIHFLVMEYIEGISLAEVVKKDGPLTLSRACDYARQVALGLQHAFEAGMVHRDLKPQNLMLTIDNRVKILDFGLARLVSDSRGGLTSENVILGTPDYMAPEQAQEAGNIDIRADIYSLGCTLYFLLTGQPPFPTGTTMGKIIAHRETMPQPAASLRPDLPSSLSQVLDRMMAKQPFDRFTRPVDVANALLPYKSHPDDRPSIPQAVTRQILPPHAPPERRKTWPRRLLLPGLACAVVGGFLFWLPNGNEPPTSKQKPGQVHVFRGHTGSVTSVIYSPDGQSILSGSLDHTVRLWDVETSKELKCYYGHKEKIRFLAFAADKRQIISAGLDAIFVWELASGKPIKHIALPLPNVTSVAVALDAELAVYGCSNGTLELWNLAKNQRIRAFTGHSERINSVVLSDDGRLVLTASGGPRSKKDKTIRLWERATGRELHCFRGHVGDVRATLSPDSQQILSVSDDTTVRLWDAESGRVICRLFGQHDHGIGAAFSPYGYRAISGGASKTIHLWNLKTGKEVYSFVGHSGTVRDLAFSPNGTYAASASEDQTVRLWALPSSPEE